MIEEDVEQHGEDHWEILINNNLEKLLKLPVEEEEAVVEAHPSLWTL